MNPFLDPMVISFKPTTWRLVHTPAAPGAWNMAVDEAILETVGRDEAPPTLRLYAWKPACLSLGYAQPVRDVNQQALTAQGWDLVRRPTGGRAILHIDELTYSVCGPHSEPRLAGSVLESYRTLSQALLRGLHLLGIPAQAVEKPIATLNGEQSAVSDSLSITHIPQSKARDSVNPVCFEVPSNYEITVNGKKLIGSAQARRKEGVLQHGSLPLYGDLARIIQVLAFPDEAAREKAALSLLARATTAEQILGAPISWETAARAFADAFRESLNLELQPAELTPTEQTRAEKLVQGKYANTEYTNRI